MPECTTCGQNLDTLSGLKTHHQLKHNEELCEADESSASEENSLNHNNSERSIIYFVDWNPECIDSTQLPVTKVGVSYQPDKRVKQIAKGTALPPFGEESLKIVATIDSVDDIYKLEDKFHKQFNAQSWDMNGEWFKLPDSVVEWIEERSATTLQEVEETNWSMFGSRK